MTPLDDLCEGNFIHIEEMDAGNIAGYFIKIASPFEEFINILIKKATKIPWGTICVSGIKKLKRINIQKKTFEET